MLADWLEERDQADRAELLRLQLRLRDDLGSPGRAAQQRRLHALLRAGTQPWAPRQQVPLGGGAELTLVLVPPGRFLMGSRATEVGRDRSEGPVRPVTLTRGYWMTATPITQAQYRAVTGNNPSQFVGASRPVDTVSWHDAVELCRALLRVTGRPFRLPSEAEWEYACRAGTTSPYALGDDVEALKLGGWCNYDAVPGITVGTAPVGGYLPNAFGLYDLHKQVWEWCADWYGPYPREAQSDPAGPPEGAARVVRGGSWYYAPRVARSAYRFHYELASSSSSHGCRLVIGEAE